MRYKRWCFAMLGMIAAVMLFIAGMNYFVDPFGYFTFQSGDYADIDFQINDNDSYQRELKAQHVLHFSSQYDAYIVGGSKSGSYRPEKFTELDGYRYYNMYEVGGTFREYAQTVRFLIENAAPKKIVLNISGGEVRRTAFMPDWTITQMPAVLTGESQPMECLNFLFKDVTLSIRRLWNRLRNGKTEEEYHNCTTGERYLESYYKLQEAAPKRYVKNHFLNELDGQLKTMFTRALKSKYYQECLDYLKEIKQMCDEAQVELLVMLAPSYIGEMSEYENKYYWDFMRDMATITDYWDFSGYHGIDMNPYNFYNDGHMFYEVPDLIVDVLKGTASFEGFGTYLTKYNISEYMQKREEQYQLLKEEYETTGTVALEGMDDASWIKRAD